MPLHESISNFLNELTAQMRDSHPPNEEITVSWRQGAGEADAALIWWSCSVSVEEGCRIWCGAPAETWEELQRAYESASQESGSEAGPYASIQQAIAKAAQQKFGSEISIEEIESAEHPGDGAAATALIEITAEGREFPPIQIAFSEAMLTALGVPAETEEVAPADWSNNPVERLLHVEVPVSVLLGRARLRMKDVLSLSGGSIVELEQDLNDEVEIRVNNCVIARGEMVAVDGNYGVRIVEMVSQNGKHLVPAMARIGGAN